ncbi:MAG: HD domain-containing protein, partial [Clostridia bacterium]|nr:HD domain-containing protein [Clostridia bacterium]
MITYEQVKSNEELKTYIRMADESLANMGFTEHSFAHVTYVAETAKRILLTLGYSARQAELAQIAAYMHDIGNIINRTDHAHNGAVMAYKLLSDMKADVADIAIIINAIGNHDEKSAYAINPITAAMIIADKSDVRRTRVRNQNEKNFDIHDRVNHSVKKSSLNIQRDSSEIELKLKIDTEECPVMDYFE